MAVQDGEKGGNDLLVTTAGFTVTGESGINIKFSRAYTTGQRTKGQSLFDPAGFSLSTTRRRSLARSHALGTLNRLHHRSKRF